MVKMVNNTRKKYLVIDSRERDLALYENPCHYVIPLQSVIKNVLAVNLVHAIYPKRDSHEMYVNFHVDEFHSNTIANNRYLGDSFAQLPMVSFLNEYKHDNSTPDNYTGRIFEQPLSKLSKLTISFYDFDGTLSVIGEHFLKFEITFAEWQDDQEEDKKWNSDFHETNALNALEGDLNNHLILPSSQSTVMDDEYFENDEQLMTSEKNNLFHKCKNLGELELAYMQTKSHIQMNDADDDLYIVNQEYKKMQKFLMRRD
jgi:hypothetical protein